MIYVDFVLQFYTQSGPQPRLGVEPRTQTAGARHGVCRFTSLQESVDQRQRPVSSLLTEEGCRTHGNR